MPYPTFTRKRLLRHVSERGRMVTKGVGSDFVTWFPVNIQSEQITTSTENAMWILRRKWMRDRNYRSLPKRIRDADANRNAGSAFTTERRYHWTSHPMVTCSDSLSATVGSRTYQGPLYARSDVAGSTSFLWPTLPSVNEFALITRGASFIARTIPTNPLAGLAVVIGELREGLPQIPGRALFKSGLRDYRKVGDEYLNYEFGIMPLVSDINKFVSVQQQAEKLIAQYSRDSGRHIRRRVTLPVETVTTITTEASGGFLAPAIPSTFYKSSSGVLTKTRVSKTTWSFSACYSYYLDPGDTYWGRIKRNEQISAKLYGTRVTPELLWELTPWSWAVDWQTNVGDVMTNVSALMSDSLVIRWAYVMCETDITDTYTMTGSELRNGPVGPFSQSFRTVRKVRRKATPYGFGLDPDAFTARQWAIIGALGISRGPRQL